MRVNVEDELFLSGRLGRFSRFLGWDERKALGMLVMIWRATQDAEISTCPEKEFISLISPFCETDAEAINVSGALYTAKLATYSDGQITIHGNDVHVERLHGLRTARSDAGRRGGKKTQQIREAKFKQNEANDKQTTSKTKQNQPLLAPSSYSNQRTQEACVRAETAAPDGMQGDKPTNLEVECEKLYLKTMASRGGGLMTRLSLEERGRLSELCSMTKDPLRALKHFLDDHNDFYVKCKWKLRFLIENINEHSGVKAKAVPTIKGDDDGSRARQRAFEARGEEDKKRLDAAVSTRTDPKQAAEEVRKIMQKLGA